MNVIAEVLCSTEHACHKARLIMSYFVLWWNIRSFTTKAPSCSALEATLEWHHGCVIWGYVLAIFWLCYSYVVAAAMAAASAGRKAVLWLPCQARRRNVCVVPMALSSLLLPFGSHLAYPGFSEEWDTAKQLALWMGSAIQLSTLFQDLFVINLYFDFSCGLWLSHNSSFDTLCST